LNAQETAQVVAICRAAAGLRVDPEKPYLIESRLAPVARREGFGSVSDLLSAITAKREESLIWAAVEAMAGGETSFFRDRTPFADFVEEIAPQLARERPGQVIRVWSAACASGQEVYSLVMAADALAAGEGSPRIEFAASDLSRLALERAQAGLYNQFEVQRGLPIRLLASRFEKDGEQWRLSPEIRRRVRWRRINLIAGLRELDRFDVVFCRYVLSHMTADAQKKVIEDLAQVVAPDGYLVLGLTEQAPSLGDSFQPVAGKAGLYRPKPQLRAAAA